jgi:hypothetical protein
VQRRRESSYGVDEVEVELGGDIGATPGTDASRPVPTPTEHLPEQVADVGTTGVTDVEREAARTASSPRSGGHRTESTNLVVLRPLGRVAQHVVRSGDLLEPLFGDGITRVLVGM